MTERSLEEKETANNMPPVTPMMKGSLVFCLLNLTSSAVKHLLRTGGAEVERIETAGNAITAAETSLMKR